MFGIASTTNALSTTFSNMGLIMVLPITTILAGFIALLGLGFGIQKLKKWIFNEPGGWGYNPQYGTGWSRFRKTDYNGTGGHAKIIEF